MAQKIPTVIKVFRLYFNSLGLLYPKYSAKQLMNLFSKPRARVLRQRELDVLNKAKKSYLKFDDEKIKVYEWGEGTKTAMLFHGWESNAGSLGAFVTPLIDQGYHVIAFDAPAHGGSEGKYSNLVYFKKAAKQMMLNYRQPEVVVGHSLGACAIIMCAFEEKMVFEKTILIAPLNRLMSVFEEYQQILTIPPKLFSRFLKRFEDFTGYSFDSFYFHQYGKQTDLEDVLLFHDVADQITKFEHAEEFEKNWEAVRLEPVEETGHYRTLWDKELVKKSMDYIES